jgi:outer membrane protein assembly factor BamB
MFQFDPAATGSRTSITGPAASEVVEQWSINLNYPTGPVFTDDRVFAVGDGVVYALDRKTGDGLWRTDIGGERVAHTPALGHGQLYVSNGTLHALDTRTGEIQWTGPGFTGENVLVRGDSVFTAGRRVDPANGSVTTKYVDDGPFAAACIADDRLFTLKATYDSNLELYVHEIADGSRVWKSEFDHDNLEDVRAPTYRDGEIYVVAGASGAVYAVDDVTGKTRWSTSLNMELVSSPAVSAERVFVTAGAGDELVAINRDTGEEQWSVKLGTAGAWGVYGPSPVVADGTVYVGSVADGCFAVDAATGEKVWTESLEGSCTSAPAVSDDTVYVAGQSLRAFENTPNSPPTATIEYDPRPAVVDESVEFRGLDSTDDGTVERYEWDLDGDGEFETTGLTARTTFTETGEHEVALRVTDNRGAADTARMTVSVADSNQPPTASFTVTPNYPVPGTELTFDGTASTDLEGDIESYEWEVDNAGVTGTGPRLRHTFTEVGDHSVVLKITDARGATATARRTVRVLGRVAGFDVTGPTSELAVGETGAVTLDVTNYVAGAPLLMPIQVNTPAGVSVAGVEGAESASGSTTAVLSVDPSDRATVRIRLQASTSGTFDVGLSASYRIGEQTEPSGEFSDAVTITATGEETTEGDDVSSETVTADQSDDADDSQDTADERDGTGDGSMPGFGVPTAVGGGALALWRSISGSSDTESDDD